MEKINLSGSVDFFDVYKKLDSNYFSEVEKMIETRLPQTILIHREKFQGAEELINRLLIDSTKRLKEIIPGAGIFWDDKLNIKPTYKDYPLVIVDVVDGSAELRRGGTEVASTLTIIFNDGSIPLSVISYPFGRERIVNVNNKVFRLPNNVLDEIDSNPELLNKYKLPNRESRNSLRELRISEKYENFDDSTRIKLDNLRKILDVSIKRPIGSLSKNLMSLVTGSCDIYMIRGKEPNHFYDTIAPRKIITDLGGVFTELDGQNKNWLDSMDGIIATSTQKNYVNFMNFMNS